MMSTTAGVTFVGGKFTNGALTGAFSRLFNDLGGAYQRVRSAVNELTASLPVLPQGLVDGAAGFGDGMSFGLTAKFRNAQGIDGGVDYGSITYQGSNLVGTFTPGLGTAAALRGAAYLGRSVKWLNQGRHWRIGPGVISRTAGAKPFNYGAGRNIPMLRIGNGAPSSLNHFDLRVLGR